MHSVELLTLIFGGNGLYQEEQPYLSEFFVNFSTWFLLCSWLMVTFLLQVTTVTRSKLEKVQIAHNNSIQSYLTHWRQISVSLGPILRTFEDRQRLLDYWSTWRKLLASIMPTNWRNYIWCLNLKNHYLSVEYAYLSNECQ